MGPIRIKYERRIKMLEELMYEYLVENNIATEGEIDLVEKIAGSGPETLRDILYVRTGYRYFGQGLGYDEEDELAVLKGELALLELIENSLPNGLSLWEKVKEPLIKDEKIRKAVRAWAELCGIDRCYFEHNEGSFASKWYGISLPTSKHGEDIESGTYTIAELCGEWDDFGGKDVRRQNPLAELSPYDYSKRNIVTDHTEPCGEDEE